MKTLAALAAAMALAACQPAPPSEPVPVASPFPANTSVVLEGDAARALSNQCSRQAPKPVQALWTPEPNMIADLEAALPALIEREFKQHRPDDARPALSYYRQYAGFVVAGRRIIYVNGVAGAVVTSEPNGDDSWRRQPASICDGGPITFGVEYDPKTRTFANFAFNGVA